MCNQTATKIFKNIINLNFSEKDLMDRKAAFKKKPYGFKNEDYAMMEYDGKTYYIWENVNNYSGNNVAYILTEKISYSTLYPKSLEANVNNQYCPYFVILGDDLSTANYAVYDYRYDWLQSVWT